MMMIIIIIMLPFGNRNVNFYKFCVEVCYDDLEGALGLVTSYKYSVEV
jgi:hypothetical protein